MDRLRVRHNHPTWCGPAAVALVTGCTVNMAAQLYAYVQNARRRPIHRHSRQSSESVSGVYCSETEMVLDLFGYDIFSIENVQGHTIRQLLLNGFREADGYKILIAIKSHYFVADKMLISDNHAQNVHVAIHPDRNESVRNAWLVTKKPRTGTTRSG